MRSTLLIIIFFLTNFCFSQSPGLEIESKEAQISEAQKVLDRLKAELVDLKLSKNLIDLKEIGLPSDSFITHSAMILEYNEAHEQAAWVAHVINPEIVEGSVARTNDFRPDPKVASGTAIQHDYFLTDTLENGDVEYDGFGFDRGHLAPSADFRWSFKALSESYFYSNMSPQLPDFNREKWAELESHLRNYVTANKRSLYVVTLPILNEELKKIERGVNKVSIPEYFAKVVYDPALKQGIGFIMKHEYLEQPLDIYAVSIDSVEAVSGLNFFKSISENIEQKFDKSIWFDNLKKGDVDPILATSLPPNHFNTIQARSRKGKKTIVCGKVVANRYSRKGHLWLNLDRKFPNQIFSIFIRKENLPNFPYDLKQFTINQEMCFEGKVESFSDSPSISLKNESQLWLFKP